MFDVDGFVADEITDYIFDGGKFSDFVQTVWEDLVDRYSYQTVVNTLNYFAQNFHDAEEAKAFRKEIGMKKNDFACDAVADICKHAALIYGIILADKKPDYLNGDD